MQREGSIQQHRLAKLRIPRRLLILLTVLITLGVIAVVSQIRAPRSGWDGIRSYVQYARFSPDYSLIASVGLGGINIWNVSDGRLLDSVAERDFFTQIAFASDGENLIWSNGPYAFVYSINSSGTGMMVGRPMRAKSEIYALAMSTDNYTIAPGSSAVELWKRALGEENHRVVADFGMENPVYALAFSGDGKLLAAGTHNGIVYMWEVDKGPAALLALPTDFKITQAFSATNQLEPFWPTAFSPDNQMLAAIGGKDGNIVAFLSIQDGHLLKQLSVPTKISTLAFSPDSNLLAVGYGHADPTASIGAQPNSIKVFSVKDSGEVWKLDLTPDLIGNMKFSQDSKSLMVGYYDRSIKTYNLP